MFVLKLLVLDLFGWVFLTDLMLLIRTNDI